MTSHSILLIDPFKNLINAYRIILEEEGYWVESALNLEEASASIQRKSYSLVMIEYIYPYEATEIFIEEIKQRSPETYILMVANALINGEAYRRLFQKGVDDLILKPYPPDRILVLIKKGIRQREMIQTFNALKRFYPFHPVTHRIEVPILNSPYFQKTVQQEFRRAKRHQRPLSLLVINIPYTQEEIAEAERFLQELLILIKHKTRSEDIVSRGNGEISLLLPETNLSGCQALIQRLHHLVESHQTFQADAILRQFTKRIKYQSIDPINSPHFHEPLLP